MSDLLDLAKTIEDAPRLGSDIDNPEGSRYIQISDTLACQWVSTIRCAIDSHEEDLRGEDN